MLFKNSAEGGSSGTTVLTSNSGGTSGDAFTGVTIGTGAGFTFDATNLAHGSLDYKIAMGSSAVACYGEWSLGATFAHLYGRLYLAASSWTSISAVRLVRFLSGTTTLAIVEIASGTPRIGIRSSADSEIVAGSVGLSANTVYRIDWNIAGLGTTSGVATVNLYNGDSTTVLDTATTSTGSFGSAAGADTIRIGNTGANFIANQSMWLDDLNVNDSAVPGIGPDTTVITPVTSIPRGMWCEFHRVANAATPNTANPGTTAARFDTVVTTVTQRSWVDSLHQYRSDLKTLLYQEGPYTRNLSNPANGYTSDCASGVSEDQASANNWYARDSGGALITNQIIQAPDNLIDIGLSAVRTAWSLNTRTRIAAGSPDTQDFQGAFADDVNFNLETSASTMPASYPDDTTWWAAVVGWFQAMYPDYTAAGLQIVPNLAKWDNWTWATDAGGINTILPYITGGMQEFWTTFASGSFSGWFWEGLTVADACIAAGKKFYVNSHGTAATARVGLAALLCCAHATDRSLTSFSWAGNQDYANEYWDDVFELDIGMPSAARTQVGTLQGGSKSLQRQFTRGWVCVNPPYNSDGTARTVTDTFSLTGGTFSGSGFYNTSSVTLAPGNAAILALPQRMRPSADVTTTGWSTTPLFSKINDSSDATVITATAS